MVCGVCRTCWPLCVWQQQDVFRAARGVDRLMKPTTIRRRLILRRLLLPWDAQKRSTRSANLRPGLSATRCPEKPRLAKHRSQKRDLGRLQFDLGRGRRNAIHRWRASRLSGCWWLRRPLGGLPARRRYDMHHALATWTFQNRAYGRRGAYGQPSLTGGTDDEEGWVVHGSVGWVVCCVTVPLMPLCATGYCTPPAGRCHLHRPACRCPGRRLQCDNYLSLAFRPERVVI